MRTGASLRRAGGRRTKGNSGESASCSSYHLKATTVRILGGERGFVTFVSRISGFAGVEPLQRRYRPLQSCYESLRSRYESLPSRYESLRGGMVPKSLCLTTAFAPVPAFLGGSCPLGCSLSAPATGGCSVVGAVLMYAAGSEEEKRAGGSLHGGTIAQSFVFCNGGCGGAS